MKALSLTQPWASLVACGAKRIETRSYRTHHTGPLAIHASGAMPGYAKDFANLTPVRLALGIPESETRSTQKLIPLGAVVATCELVKCMPTELVSGMETGGRIYSGDENWLVSEQELSFGCYSSDRFAWLLANIQALKNPVPAKGALSLWNWDWEYIEYK